jgi:dihydrolipoamide dehydrogenase
LEKYTCLPKWDKDVREFIFRNLAWRKMKIHEGVEVKEIRGKGKVESVVAEVNGKKKVFPCDAVMLSIGLTPNSESAQQLGVKIGANNEIVVDEGMRTSVPGIFAVGDVVGPPYFMALARKGGMVAAKNIFGTEAKMDYSYVPEHVYIPPLEATYVGLTEEEARKQYKNVVVIKVPVGERPQNIKPEKYIPGYSGMVLPICGRMHTLNLLYYGKNIQGMLKAIIDADSRRYLGFHHVGDGAKVSFQYLSYLLKQGWTVDQMTELNEVFLNAEHFIQLTRLVGGYKELINFC